MRTLHLTLENDLPKHCLQGTEQATANALWAAPRQVCKVFILVFFYQGISSLAWISAFAFVFSPSDHSPDTLVLTGADGRCCLVRQLWSNSIWYQRILIEKCYLLVFLKMTSL